jgi:hypothetical protein
MSHIPSPPLIPGSSFLTTLNTSDITASNVTASNVTASNVTASNVTASNATIENATIENLTTLNITNSIVLEAPTTTNVPLLLPPLKVPYSSATYYYRFRNMNMNSFNTIFTTEMNTNYYCMGSTAADNDNNGPPVIFMVSNIFQVGVSIYPILGSVDVDFRISGNEVQVMSHGGNYRGLNMTITVFSAID